MRKLLFTILKKTGISVLQSIINLKIKKIKLNYLIGVANDRHKVTGKRYFVIPYGSKMLVVDNNYIANYNKQVKSVNMSGVNKLTIKDVLECCLYSTPVGTTNKR